MPASVAAVRILRRLFFAGLLGLPLVILLCQWLVIRAGAKRTYDEVAQIPARETALVLGTNPKLGGGSPNAFFEARLDAAAALYRAGKVQRLLLSGDNRKANYDEPNAMKDGLLARGVPASAITLDFAGFRTLDSVVRAGSVFGLTKFTIISQKFHNERALLIAQRAGLDAIGFNASGPDVQAGAKVYGREIFARVRAVLDLYVLQTKPHFPAKKHPLEM